MVGYTGAGVDSGSTRKLWRGSLEQWACVSAGCIGVDGVAAEATLACCQATVIVHHSRAPPEPHTNLQTAIERRDHVPAAPLCSLGGGVAGSFTLYTYSSALDVITATCATTQFRRQDNEVCGDLRFSESNANPYPRTGKPILTVSGGRSSLGGTQLPACP